MAKLNYKDHWSNCRYTKPDGTDGFNRVLSYHEETEHESLQRMVREGILTPEQYFTIVQREYTQKPPITTQLGKDTYKHQCLRMARKLAR